MHTVCFVYTEYQPKGPKTVSIGIITIFWEVWLRSFVNSVKKREKD